MTGGHTAPAYTGGVPGPASRADLNMRSLELGGGRVTHAGARWRLALPARPAGAGYADAQLDDYVGRSRRAFPWRRGITLRLRARFSHEASALAGTAGFGLWNAPLGDPRRRWPALPQAVWFFFASPPTDLPWPLEGPGRGWFAGTVAASGWPAIRLAPIALPLWLGQQLGSVRRRLWPALRRALGLSFASLPGSMTDWHDYALAWSAAGCAFFVDGRPLLRTRHSPSGPLGLVCWLDNQFLVLTPRGRVRAGTVPVPAEQWLEIEAIAVTPTPPGL